MTKAAISLGSNHNAEVNLNLALNALKKEFKEIQISTPYKTSPVGIVADDFINLVVVVQTQMGIGEFFNKCREIEKLVPLEKALGVYRRGLDLDILTFGDFIGCYLKHKIPRPDLLEHNFALRPLAELCPNDTLPTNGKTFATLWLEYEDKKQIMQAVQI